MDIAARKGGRNPETVRLIAVTKTVPVEQIREASRAGARCFGENRIQEAVEKIDRLKGEDLRWHFIGHLQKNKVKFIFGRFDLIHSVDGAELAETISRKSLEHGERMPILIQVNVSGEASKFGLPPPSLESTLRAVAKLEGVQVRGLMTIPPFDPDPERSRPYFARLRELRDRCAGMGIENISLDELSMGMSSDFLVAIEEGATLVRVGTAIFGERPAPGK